MYAGVKEVKPLPDFKLLLVFANGERRQFDVSSYLNHGIFQALKDPTVFNSAHISFDTVAWSNGADLCPEVLYRDSIPVDKTSESRSPDRSKRARARDHS